MSTEVLTRSTEPTQGEIDDLIAEVTEYVTEHEHRHVILVGNAPITMMAGAHLPEFRACACGDQIYVGSYLYDPIG
jgi:hypothetical protein